MITWLIVGAISGLVAYFLLYFLFKYDRSAFITFMICGTIGGYFSALLVVCAIVGFFFASVSPMNNVEDESITEYARKRKKASKTQPKPGSGDSEDVFIR